MSGISIWSTVCTYVSIHGGSILPLELRNGPDKSSGWKTGKMRENKNRICCAGCRLNIEIFSLKIDIVMSFVFDVWRERGAAMLPLSLSVFGGLN